MIQLRIWRGQILCPCARAEALGRLPRSMMFPKTGTHPASSAGQAFSAPCSGVLAHLFHMFLNLWLSAATHKRVLHCSSAIDCGGPNRDGCVQGGLVVQQVRLPSSCFDSEAPATLRSPLLPAVRPARKEREHL